MSIIKELIEVTARCHCVNATVLEFGDKVIVARAGRWPVVISIKQLFKEPYNNGIVVYRLAKKLKQSGVMVK